MKNNIVYFIQFDDKSFYFGRTKKTAEMRFKEHRNVPNNKKYLLQNKLDRDKSAKIYTIFKGTYEECCTKELEFINKTQDIKGCLNIAGTRRHRWISKRQIKQLKIKIQRIKVKEEVLTVQQQRQKEFQSLYNVHDLLPFHKLIEWWNKIDFRVFTPTYEIIERYLLPKEIKIFISDVMKFIQGLKPV